MKYEKYRKVAVMGYPGVGKTAMTEQFLTGNFPQHYQPTILSQTRKPDYHFNNETFFVDVIDTAGYHEYSTLFLSSWSLASTYGFILVYSIDSLKSFQVIRDMTDKIYELTGSNTTPLVIVGNKLDLAAENQREVSTSAGEKLVKNFKNAEFLEISAKNHSQVDRVFQKLLLRIEKGQDPKKSLRHRKRAPSGGTCVIS